MRSFDEITAAIDRIIGVEGDFVDHKDDRGGATRWGITEPVARANGYKGDMRDLPRELAHTIYMRRYVQEPWFDAIFAMDTDIGYELIDTGINMGPSRPAAFFQRSLNVLNLKGSKYADLFVDGRIGPVTVQAFSAYLGWRGQDGRRVMMAMLNGLQTTRYVDIAENNESQESFIFGWVLQRVVNQGNH